MSESKGRKSKEEKEQRKYRNRRTTHTDEKYEATYARQQPFDDAVSQQTLDRLSFLC